VESFEAAMREVAALSDERDAKDCPTCGWQVQHGHAPLCERESEGGGDR
jgi:hypothetical protein